MSACGRGVWVTRSVCVRGVCGEGRKLCCGEAREERGEREEVFEVRGEGGTSALEEVVKRVEESEDGATRERVEGTACKMVAAETEGGGGVDSEGVEADAGTLVAVATGADA